VNDGHRTGIPEVDSLIDAADRARIEGWNLAVVGTAESTVADARLSDIAGHQKAARQRWATAQNRLAEARKIGDKSEIAAAHRHETAAYREFDAISQGVIAEAFGIVAASTEGLGRQLDQLQLTDAAEAAVLAALRPRWR